METVIIKVRSLEFGVRSICALIVCGICLLFFVAQATYAAASWQWIDGPRVQGKLKEGSGLWLIDVRSAAAYEAAHIEGSVNIPADTLSHKKFPPQKTLILVDDTLGQKAAREAANALVQNGQERVSIIEGGLAAWKLEGLPIVENKAFIRGVTSDELKWALAQSLQMKLYDLRDAKEQKKGALRTSEPVAGKTVAERIEKLKKMLSGGKKKKDLAAKMKKTQPVVLVFSASDDAEGYVRKLLQGTNMDVRYLIGGYEATISDKIRSQQTVGDCPTCPKKGK